MFFIIGKPLTIDKMIQWYVHQQCYVCKKPNTIHKTDTWQWQQYHQQLSRKTKYLSPNKNRISTSNIFFCSATDDLDHLFQCHFKSPNETVVRVLPPYNTHCMLVSVLRLSIWEMLLVQVHRSVSAFTEGPIKAALDTCSSKKASKNVEAAIFQFIFSIFRVYNQMLYACTLIWRMEVKKIICFVKYQIRLRNWGVLH